MIRLKNENCPRCAEATTAKRCICLAYCGSAYCTGKY